ncbi:hypothetical protein [Leptospira meyeri]|uniref:hypothetical protein n=1 Tax=Leptospira meyeri TaxID=29508 RepID=UPI001083440E|nr:hypothetical protein [Leptospira meyeri]TGM21993.1 hypothetical protein EHQ73_09360 [Leptospira meyeri]
MIDQSLVDIYNQERNRTNWTSLTNEDKIGYLVDAETEIAYHPSYSVPQSELNSQRYIAAIAELSFHRFNTKKLPGKNVKRVKNSRYEEEFFEQKEEPQNSLSWPPIVVSMLSPWLIRVSLRVSTIR